MSYILDALKKAERERGVTRLPILPAARDIRGTHRRRLVAIAGGMVLSAAAILWFLLPVLTRVIRPAGRVQTISGTPVDLGAGSSTAKDVPTPRQPESPPPSNSDTLALPSTDSRAVAAPAAAPPAGVSRSVSEPVTPAQKGRESPPPPSVAPPSPGMPSQESLASASQPGPQASARAEVEAAREAAVPAGAEQAKPAPLKEAVSKMTLTLIMYSENEAERFVFINGRRYAKGDRVDDVYLVESITLEGAVLGYEGEKVLLRR